jgi:hypothetical protein
MGMGRMVDSQSDYAARLQSTNNVGTAGIEAAGTFKDDCLNQIGKTREQLMSVAGSSRYFDSRSPQGDISIASVLGPGYLIRRGETFHSVVPFGVAAVVLSRRDRTITGNVVLGANFFSKGLSMQKTTLLHEMMHTLTNLGDVGFARTYLGFTGSDVTAASQAITDWVTKCR